MTSITPPNGEKTSKPTEQRTCPSCGSKRVAEILYGMPDGSDEYFEALKNEEITVGGCCITPDSPKWECVACGHKWGVLPQDDLD